MSRPERVLLAAVFLAWAAVAISASMTHEPWWDEAQAWLIARDVPTGELLTRVLRYEGHPPLWYLLLKIPVRLGLPYSSMKVLSFAFGAVTVLLLLYAFPYVPLYVRMLVPFALFIAYQYTVVARSYVLMGPLLLLIAHMWDRRTEHPWRFTLLLMALSHVSIHGLAIAGGLAAYSVFEKRRLFAGPAIAFAANAALLVWILVPARDNISHINHHETFSIARYSRLVTDIVPELFWGPPEYGSPLTSVLTTLIALVALAILTFWLMRRGTLGIIVLPVLGVFLISARYYNMWHEGIFFFLLLFASVLAFARPPATRALEIAGRAVLVLLLIRNAQWTFQSLAFEIPLEYTGSQRAARFLRERGLHEKKLYGFGISALELQPYFDRNLYDNWTRPTAYWEWSPSNPWPYTRRTAESKAEQARWIERALAERPDVIVYAIGLREDEFEQTLVADPHYRRTGSFHGVTFWKTRPTWPIGFDIYERITPPPGTPAASAPRSAAR